MSSRNGGELSKYKRKKRPHFEVPNSPVEVEPLSFAKTFDPTAGHVSKKKCEMAIFLAQVFGYTRLLRSSRVTEFK